MFTLLKTDNKARRGVVETVHGSFQTPCFMNVGTAAAIKGGISSVDLKGLKTQVELCNTYHLHLRPGDKIVKEMGGLHKFMEECRFDRQRRISGILTCTASQN